MKTMPTNLVLYPTGLSLFPKDANDDDDVDEYTEIDNEKCECGFRLISVAFHHFMLVLLFVAE